MAPMSTNKSGHTGVSLHKASGEWQASIQRDGKQRHLGFFVDLEDAIAARKQAEKESPAARTSYDAETQAWIDSAETKEERKKRQQRAKYLKHGDKYRERLRDNYATNPEKFLERNAKYRRENPEKVSASKIAWEKQDRAKHPEKYNAKWKSYYAANKDKILVAGRKWREENPEHKVVAAESARKYREKNRDKINHKQREEYAAAPEEQRARAAQWRKDNPDQLKVQSERQTERYRTDPEYRDYKLQKCRESYERRFPDIQEYERMRWKRDQEKLSEYRKKWREENEEELAIKHLEWKRKDKLRNPGKWKAWYAADRAMRAQRTPPWANMKAIRYIYENCPEGYEVDHIIPLRGKNISGLHVPENLQYLTMTENRMKGNSWEGNE